MFVIKVFAYKLRKLVILVLSLLNTPIIFCLNLLTNELKIRAKWKLSLNMYENRIKTFKKKQNYI